MQPNIPPVKRRCSKFSRIQAVWWKILAAGFLLVLGISLGPTAYCTLADCTEKDRWCSADCSQACGPTNGLGVVVGCTRGAYGCIQDWIPDGWGVNCTNPEDCQVTDCASTPPGFGCYLAGDGRWDVGACSAYPDCQRQTRIVDATCCSSPDPTPCPESPPTITTPALQPTPAYPLVIGQDPDGRGVTISNITVSAGEHDCRSGTITAISVRLSLRPESIAWINGELARCYPGAHVLGTYPLSPPLTTTGLGTPSATAAFRFDPLDPGDYEVTLTAWQDDGQTAVKVFTVHVALYESTITH